MSYLGLPLSSQFLATPSFWPSVQREPAEDLEMQAANIPSPETVSQHKRSRAAAGIELKTKFCEDSRVLIDNIIAMCPADELDNFYTQTIDQLVQHAVNRNVPIDRPVLPVSIGIRQLSSSTTAVNRAQYECERDCAAITRGIASLIRNKKVLAEKKAAELAICKAYRRKNCL